MLAVKEIVVINIASSYKNDTYVILIMFFESLPEMMSPQVALMLNIREVKCPTMKN